MRRRVTHGHAIGVPLFARFFSLTAASDSAYGLDESIK
jgi:hypothetical protein